MKPSRLNPDLPTRAALVQGDARGAEDGTGLGDRALLQEYDNAVVVFERISRNNREPSGVSLTPQRLWEGLPTHETPVGPLRAQDHAIAQTCA